MPFGPYRFPFYQEGDAAGRMLLRNLRGTITPQRGDANFDGHVDFTDFLILEASYGLSTAHMTPLGAWESGDFDLDGVVGFGDFLLLQDNYDDPS